MSQMPALNLAGLISGGSGLMDIVKQLQQAQTAANKANETRYQDILKSYDTLGQAGQTRIGQQEQAAQAKGTQDLTSRGLGNTTITSAVSRGVANDAELQRQQLAEGVAEKKAGVMERKTDQGPDMSMYAQLLAQAGKGSGDRERFVNGRSVGTMSDAQWGQQYKAGWSR